MKWSDTIPFSRALRDVLLLKQAPSQDWHALLREREQAAYERGRQDGEKSLREQLLQQRTEMVQLQQGVVEALRNAAPQVVQQSEIAMIQLALEAAQRIVAGVPISLELVEAVVRETLRQAEDSTEVTVQLHPDDLELLRKHDSPVLKGSPGGGVLRFVSSSEVTRGSCLVQTRFGLIDARRETKLEQIRESLAA